MAEDKKKEKDLKKKKDNKKRMKIAAVAISDNIIYSKDEQWAYYRISNSVFDFLSTDAKISSAQQLINAFVSLMSDRQEPVDCHIIIASTPVDVDAWEEQVMVLSEDWKQGPGFEQYIQDQGNYLREEEFLKKVTYLGIRVGRRGALALDTENFLDHGVKGALETVKTWLSTALQTPSEEIAPSEEKEARRREDSFHRTLSIGNLRAERCSAEELLLLIKRQFYPAMAAPYLDVDHGSRIGPGDLDLELTSAIENKLRYLRVNQIDGDLELDGYRATLTISRLPKEINFPYSTFPFLYFLYKLGLPFTSYSRFTLHPTAQMKKQLEKKKKEQKDELENLAGAGTLDSELGVVPTDVQEAMEDMNLLTEMLQDGRTPWVEGTYRIVVETGTEKALKKYTSLVKQRYTDLDININWTVGDQALLFLEQMPGDKLRSDSHKQLTNLAMFGTSGFSYSSDVGDEIYVGDAMGGS